MNDDPLAEILDSAAEAPVEVHGPGSLLVEEGRMSGRLFVLLDGAVEVLRGGTLVAVVSERGAVFGEMSALLGVPHTATVRARTEVTVRAPEDAGGFLRRHPDLVLHLARLLARRLDAASAYLVDMRRQYAGHGGDLAMVAAALGMMADGEAGPSGDPPA